MVWLKSRGGFRCDGTEQFDILINSCSLCCLSFSCTCMVSCIILEIANILHLSLGSEQPCGLWSPFPIAVVLYPTQEGITGPRQLPHRTHVTIQILSGFGMHGFDSSISLTVPVLVFLITMVMFSSEPLCCFENNPLHTLVPYLG